MNLGHTGPVRMWPYVSMLRSMRWRFGLTQAELAREVGASRETISSLECRRSIPSLTLARALARQLDLSTDELFPDSDLS